MPPMKPGLDRRILQETMNLEASIVGRLPY